MITKPAQFEAVGIKSEIFTVVEPKEGRGGIYISNFFSAMNLQLLQKYSVRAILTIAKGCFLTYTKQQIPNYLYIPIDDKSSVDISQYFERCFSFIEKSRARTNVLIHCKVGVSRSATILIAFLMAKMNFSLKEAYDKLKQANPRIKPNNGFMQQLQELQIKIHGKEEFIDNRPKSLQNSPTKNQILEESNSNSRHMSLCKRAKQLQGITNNLQTKISRLKGLIETENTRKRSNSQFLRRKMTELREKKVIEQNSQKQSLKNIFSKRLEKNL